MLSEDEEVLLRSQFATLKGKGKRIEEHLAEHNDQFRVVFEAIRQLLSEEEYREALDNYGLDSFVAKIGAEAVRDLLCKIDGRCRGRGDCGGRSRLHR